MPDTHGLSTLGAQPAEIAAAGVSRRLTRRTAFIGIALFVLVGAAAPLGARILRPVPPTDIGTLKTSIHSLYRVRLAAGVSPIPVQQLHQWTAYVEPATPSPRGNPSTVAPMSVSFDGGMPQHGHGLPTSPRVTGRLPDGRFVIDGVRFSMPGWWELRLRVSGSAGVDSVVFNLSI